MPPQPPLLPGIPPPDPLRQVPPAVPHGELLSLAGALPEGFFAGPSSWAYPGWTGLVWEGQHKEAALSRHGLAATAAFPVFRAVGIDRSFHAPVETEQYATWADEAPGMRFLVKAHRDLTTPLKRGEDGEPVENERFLDPGWAEESTIDPAWDGLGEQLGALVFQLSAEATREAGGRIAFLRRLQRLLEALPKGPLYAVEIRDPTVLTPDYRQVLERTGAVPCLNVQPGMPPPDVQQHLVGFSDRPLVLRWLTRPDMSFAEARARFAPFEHLGAPDPESRRRIAGLVVQALRRGQPALVTATNRAEGSIPLSIAGLCEQVVRRMRGRS